MYQSDEFKEKTILSPPAYDKEWLPHKYYWHDDIWCFNRSYRELGEDGTTIVTKTNSIKDSDLQILGGKFGGFACSYHFMIGDQMCNAPSFSKVLEKIYTTPMPFRFIIPEQYQDEYSQ